MSTKVTTLLFFTLLSFSVSFSPLFSPSVRCRTILASNSDEQDRLDRLSKLGYSQDELNRNKDPDPLPENVAVTEVDVDPFTLTAVGFLALAANFLLFANMGDGGIAGLVARFQNTFGN